MGRPKTRRALSASRFHEGSMNDRTSAAPPVQFMGPDEIAALERPVSASIRSQPRPVSDDWADKQVKQKRLLGQVWDGVRGRLRFKKDGEDERGSRRRERSRKRDQSESRGRQRERDDRSREEKPIEEPQREEMPSREEILANYHHLMASGFFSSHAIQSTRQPPPGSSRSSTQSSSHSSVQPPTPASSANILEALSRAPTPQNLAPRPPVSRVPTPRAPTPRAPTPTPTTNPTSPSRSRHFHRNHSPQHDPQAATYEELVACGFFSPPAPAAVPPPTPKGAAPAPLVHTGQGSRDYLQPPQPTRKSSRSRSVTPSVSRSHSPLQSPASASSRGTKRAAVDPTSDDEDDDAARDPPTPNKKLRKMASRDIAIPKLRNVASRRAILSRRSVSGPHGSSKERNTLARRVLGHLPGGNGRSSFDSPDRRTEAASRRSADVPRRSADVPRQPLQEVQHSRVLRSRRSAAEALRVAPNTNRGIPKVPNIPEKFTIYDEDAENIAPAVHISY
ncbi:uncharacterized protein NECHADRAFT_98592 [Fusarium vanettenii 77-13-4]|uniref:Uncharacterized protein n=1 Tax=Fusarium vanettenii (strain ATCC MYA-4622 / CBS 123669 / FGSC 9596 / NRRL 45880 / 77-13-4) TaxID=660122 RepID=C7YWI7_FUSV7|nr:uncharacterized protein NECHADRAFT_98592 [Fusarium vanettenii 77-13-4]EEU44189.1 hypothetical protein NECHADRAFT_98592 [Fusarium vanettenii 77-13-4]